ncbi:UDP-N-acetylmuramate dehydrogenase [Natronospira proteinivora]|uniref:UDP-N-acetylenolpyruvoylglucosamine reductase n=1 Tax=Natronospira proteinivora TaxID=1807133 RepID=A0ABT1G937_9GAMM|nr:UDP-N-acetylmuramate dehydrogenase [Natronospira proteinivora]MCP1727841.1 UDP-N-acetylmuramate dehydrogenase [Natronospira proteinivora]
MPDTPGFAPESTPPPAPRLIRAADLAALNTFGVSARAQYLAVVDAAGQLPGLLNDPVLARLPRLVLGGGSNLLFTGDFPGLVVRMAERGIQRRPLNDTGERLWVGAGENWDGFVRWSLAEGFEGLENLILIPGSVGAAPMQNIGAYGVEVADFIDAVRVWDCQQAAFRTLAPADCDFAYRDSIFKRHRDRYLITHVAFRLPYQRERVLDYAGVREALADKGIEQPSASQVADVIEALRRSKLPDPAEIGNVGSFFKNPQVSHEQANTLKARHPELPGFETGQGVKLSAAWMIEACGFKGHQQGKAAVSDRHALVLINRGGATGAELWALAQAIQAAVEARFGVILEPEPLVV